ncbi:MAG: polysaccharide deacetylase family protein [Paludibacter sp.]|nr:polysaccharide deacetylase family protein [Paludibacter sp.]
MKRALTQAFTKDRKNLVCEFHVTTKNNYLHMKLIRIALIAVLIFNKQIAFSQQNDVYADKYNENSKTVVQKVPENNLDLEKLNFHIAKFKGDKECAISYTFDDGLLEHATLVAPKMENLGFRGTFWINGKTIDNNDSTKPRVTWKQLKKMSRKGHEVSNHGWSHTNLNRIPMAQVKIEIAKNDSAIYVNTGVYPQTFCYPFNAKSDSVIAIASENRIDTRTKQISLGGKITSENIDRLVEEMLNNHEWVVTMTHGISYGYDHFNSEVIFYNHLQKVKNMEDKIWVDTFRKIGAYIKEEKAITLKINNTSKGYIVTPSLQLDENLFKEHLTAVIDSIDIKSVKIFQNYQKLKTIVYPDKIMFDFDPFGGAINIVITKNKK